jgi:6-phosphogluconolactonase
MPVVSKKFQDRDGLVVKLAGRIAALLAAGIKSNGKASLAVSGGSTPVALFERLSGMDIPWQDVVITLVDERWVEPTENDSNERLVKNHLLQNKANAATFIGMKNAAPTAGAGEAECEQRLQKAPLPFDVLILGMGGDGHIASLFPGADKLVAATDMDSGRSCIGLAPLTAPHERMSLTLPAILNSRQIFLHIVGKDKKHVLKKANTDGPAEELPIRFILRQQTTPLSIYWAP